MENAKMGLLTVVLSIIFMSGGVIKDSEWRFDMLSVFSWLINESIYVSNNVRTININLLPSRHVLISCAITCHRLNLLHDRGPSDRLRTPLITDSMLPFWGYATVSNRVFGTERKQEFGENSLGSYASRFGCSVSSSIYISQRDKYRRGSRNGPGVVNWHTHFSP